MYRLQLPLSWEFERRNPPDLYGLFQSYYVFTDLDEL